MDGVPSQARCQPMDVTSLKAVLAEWRTCLLPSRFEKAQQASPHSIQIALRSLQGCHWLELSWQAEAARVHTIPAPPRQGEGSTLAQQLQHSLRGLALIHLEQPGWERVLKLGFARRPDGPIARWLVVELMGRHSNLLLLDGEEQVIALARQVKPQQSRLRPIGTGDAYGPPPPLPGEPPTASESITSWQRRLRLLPLPLARALASAYQGISPALVAQLLPPGWAERPVDQLSEDQWQELWQRWQHWLQQVDSNSWQWQVDPTTGSYRCWLGAQPAAPLTGQPAAQPASQPPDPLAINRALASYYGSHLERQQLAQRRHQLTQRLAQATAKESRDGQELQARLDAVPQSDGLQQQADAYLSQQEPSRQCIDTAQKLYKQARKLRRSVAAITPRLEWHQQRLAALEASLTYLEQATSLAEIEALASELDDLLGSERSQKPTNRRQRRQANNQPIQPLQLQSSSGLVLQVGRNHRQNEWIAFQQARRGDLWFHAQELPGSHVVLKASEGLASDADLQAAADLAAHFSRGRGNGRVPVVMVPVEGLQRIPGAAAGTVRHRPGEQFWGEPDRALSLLRAQQP